MTRIALIACVAASLAAPALAEPTVKVAYGDLNLQSRPGARQLLARLHAAARKVCGPAPIIADLGRDAAYRGCLKATVNTAVSDLNAPLVTAAYEGLGATSRTVAAVGDAR